MQEPAAEAPTKFQRAASTQQSSLGRNEIVNYAQISMTNTGYESPDGFGDDSYARINLEKQQSENSGQDALIRDVWIGNFFSTMDSISKLIDEYNYIAMDTEYPGTVYVPINTDNEFEYQMLKANCENLKLIQVGISLFNQKGDSPSTLAWQFNLQFDEHEEQSIEDSMDLLRQSGFSFEKHKNEGIPHQLLAEYLITSGLVMNHRNHWITFHGGVDFGYLLKQLLGTSLPLKQDDFLDMVKWYFGNFYDCKEIKRDLDYLSGGLGKIAKELDINRIGTMHQAGSDAYVTACVFFKLRSQIKKMRNIESDSKMEERLNGKIYGIGDSINDDTYIESYKNCSKKLQFRDHTGHVNLRLYALGHSAQEIQNTTNTTNTLVSNSHSHSMSLGQNNTSVRHHSSSAHGMLSSGNGLMSVNSMSLNGMVQIGQGNGHHSSLGMEPIHSLGKNNSHWMPSNNSSNLMGNSHSVIGMNQNTGHLGLNYGNLNQNPHNSSQGLDHSNIHNQLGSLMQGTNIDISSMGHNGLIPMGLGGLTTYNQGQMANLGLGSSSQNQHGNNNQQQNSLQMSHQHQMLFMQPTDFMGSGVNTSGMDNSDMMGGNNYVRMMNMQTSGNQGQMGQYNHGQHQYSHQSAYLNFQHYSSYMDPSFGQQTTGNQSTGGGHMSSSPSLMGIMHHNTISSGHMSQMQQHNYYMPNQSV